MTITLRNAHRTIFFKTPLPTTFLRNPHTMISLRNLSLTITRRLHHHPINPPVPQRKANPAGDEKNPANSGNKRSWVWCDRRLLEAIMSCFGRAIRTPNVKKRPTTWRMVGFSRDDALLLFFVGCRPAFYRYFLWRFSGNPNHKTKNSPSTTCHQNLFGWVIQY